MKVSKWQHRFHWVNRMLTDDNYETLTCDQSAHTLQRDDWSSRTSTVFWSDTSGSGNNYQSAAGPLASYKTKINRSARKMTFLHTFYFMSNILSFEMLTHYKYNTQSHHQMAMYHPRVWLLYKAENHLSRQYALWNTEKQLLLGALL